MRSIITVSAAAVNTALVSLDRVKLELDITVTDYDDILTAKIEEASSDIAIRCWPSLKRETVAETFFHDHRHRFHYRERVSELRLRRFPVKSIATVTLDGTVIDPSQYRLDGISGLLYSLDCDGYPSSWRFAQALEVDYLAGYLVPDDAGFDPEPDETKLPAALQGAALQLLSSYWASRGRDQTLMQESVPGVAEYRYWVGAVGAAGDLPPGVMASLAPFVRVNVG